MGEITKISWCDSTFNPWIGCTKVSPGCANCYAEHYGQQFGVEWGEGKPRRRTSESIWRRPLAWNKRAAGRLFRDMVFCGSLCDWLDPEVPIQWLADLLDLIRQTRNLDWLLLTKRPENWKQRIDAAQMAFASEGRFAASDTLVRWLNGTPPTNVWVGATAEDQDRLDERATGLLAIPAAKRFLSCEPMLEELDLSPAFGHNSGCGGERAVEGCEICGHLANKVDWVIFGGESGRNARRCDVNWIRSGVRQCREAGVAPFVKQLGAMPIRGYDLSRPGKGPFAGAIGDAWTLRSKNGSDMDEWPRYLKVREFPNC